jgi:hypothetical protein
MSGWHDPAPGERDAQERAWDVVRRAYAERLPAARPHRRRSLLLAAAAAAVLAATLSPPGLAVWGSLRDAVRGDENAKQALFSLPVPHSRLLVDSAEGTWVVQSDGSKRLLSGYREASWSPHGLYLAAVHGDELRALEPDGDVHWSIARRGGIRAPRWSFDGYRIAYVVGRSLRVINGDGTGDHLLTRNVRPTFWAWVPRTHRLAYFTHNGTVVVVDVDRRGTPARPRAAGVVVSGTASPDGKRVALIDRRGGESVVKVNGAVVFRGAGVIAGAVWSPDGRWLLLAWPTADQWLFIRTPVKRLIAVQNIRANFGPAAVPAGWCCS